MKNFKSKFHFWKVYFMMTFCAVFFFGLGYGLMFEFAPKPGNSRTWLFIFGATCIVSGACLLYNYVKQLPVIRIDYQGIRLKSLLRNQEFSWSDIESVKYTGKDSLLGSEMEALVMKLKDKRVIKLFYEHYANGYLIQQYIKSYHEHQQPPELVSDKPVSLEELSEETFTDYKGIPWLSFRGICLWVLIFPVIIMIINDAANGYSRGIVPAVLMCLFWYGINSYFCFYVKLSQNYLVVKNYFVPFIIRRYRLSDIQEIAIETNPKWPNCLRVITHSYRYKVFPCGLVRDKEWKLILKRIRHKGIVVRNEVFLD